MRRFTGVMRHSKKGKGSCLVIKLVYHLPYICSPSLLPVLYLDLDVFHVIHVVTVPGMSVREGAHKSAQNCAPPQTDPGEDLSATDLRPSKRRKK
jgi:hypothetical protein